MLTQVKQWLAGFFNRNKPQDFQSLVKQLEKKHRAPTEKEVNQIIARGQTPLCCHSNRAHRYGLRKYTW